MKKTEKESCFSNNVIWFNFILCILVVFIHARNDSIFTEPVLILGTAVFDRAEAFLAADIAGAAVGGFYLCSGYLFFRSYSWDRVLEKYKNRARSLLIPYILWTLIYFFIHVVISRIPVLAAVFQEPPIEIGWRTILDAVLHYRYCAFLWFLQFLILYAAVSPAVYLLIRSRYAGAAAILVVSFTACTNIIKNEQAAAVTNWLVLYMLGGYLGLHWRDAIETKKQIQNCLREHSSWRPRPSGSTKASLRFSGCYFIRLHLPQRCGACLRGTRAQKKCARCLRRGSGRRIRLPCI